MNKRNWIYYLTIVFGIASLAYACDNGNSEYLDGPHGYGIDPNGLYEVNSETHKLDFAYNDSSITDKGVEFLSTDRMKTTTLTFENVIAGESKTVLDSVALTLSEDSTRYNFEEIHISVLSDTIRYFGYFDANVHVEGIIGGYNLLSLHLESKK